jgi:IstB-like ATP binding protein
MTKTSELAHLFRQLKAPAAARALPELAERAREEQWSYERFAEALLSTEVASRESRGGESRIKAARFPALKTLQEFDWWPAQPAFSEAPGPGTTPKLDRRPDGSTGLEAHLHAPTSRSTQRPPT